MATPITVGELAELCDAAKCAFLSGKRKGWMPDLDIDADMERLIKAWAKVAWKVRDMQDIPANIEEVSNETA